MQTFLVTAVGRPPLAYNGRRNGGQQAERNLRRWLGSKTVTLLTAAALLLALADMALVLSNRVARREFDERRQFIDQTAQLNRVNESLVRQIARAAIDEKDQKLRDLLTRHGIRIEGDPPSGPVASAAPSPAPGGQDTPPAPAASPEPPVATQTATPSAPQTGPEQRFTIRFDDRLAALTPPSIQTLDAAVTAARSGAPVKIEIEGCPALADSSNLCARRVLSATQLLAQRGVANPQRLLAGSH